MHTGRHFLQIPGPTNVPDRVLRAMAAPVMDHRGPEFAALSKEIQAGLRRVFKTDSPPGGERSQLKHLASFDNAIWHVREWNPPNGTTSEFTLSRKEWPICHRVVGKWSR